MNCSSARNRILALADPAVLPEALLGHVNGCSACQTWHRLAIQVDAAVAAIGVPISEGKGKRQLMSQFQVAPTRAARPKLTQSAAKEPAPIIHTPAPTKATVRPATPRKPLGERLAHLWPAGLVAAAILIGAVSWAIFGGKTKENQALASAGPDPMLKDVVSAKVELDTAGNTPERIKALAKLADKLHEEARTLSKVSPGDEMTSLAAMYKRVVEEALVPQAKALSEDERKSVLPQYRQQLIDAEQEANRLAAEAPIGSDQALKEIAEAARAGRIELAKLIQGSRL